MNAFAQYALTASVVASALGGIVLSLLLLLETSTPADKEPPGAVARRRLLVRLGHTVAAACFAITSVLAIVVMSRQAVTAGGADAGPLAHEVRALDARVSGVERLVQRIAASVDTLVRRVEPDDAVSTSVRSEKRDPRSR